MQVVGKRAFGAFFAVTFLVVAILAATNVVSKYALKNYTEDQVKRINWDAIAYQTSDISEMARVKKEISEIDGVASVRDSGSMKLSLGTFMHLDINGGKTTIPWFMLLSSEDYNLLPPELRPENGKTLTALVGPQAMISPYLDKISVGNPIAIFAEDPYDPKQKPTQMLSASIERMSTPERLEIVKFFLDKFGSATFIPEGLILVMPKDAFDREMPRIINLVHELSKPQPLLGGNEEGQGQTEPEEDNLSAMVIPEIMHLVSVDRAKVFTGWDLDASYNNAAGLVSKIKGTVSKTSFDSFVNSELLVTLEKMAKVSKLIGLLTILISVPILWLAWLFAGSLANLIILNQRRLVGLLRLRGASYGPIRTSLLTAIGLGGILGGTAGALVGTFVPYFLIRMSGVEIPLGLLFTTIQEPWVLGIFILLGTGFGLLAGRKVTNYLAQITPLEASRRVASSEESEFKYQFSKFQIFCLIAGGAKVAGWIAGFTPGTELMKTVDTFLNFVGAAFFLYGITAIIVSRRRELQAVLGALAKPLAQSLDWFAVKTMMTHPHRIMTVILVAALTFGVVVYPQITSKSFYEKTVRALRLNLGSDIAVRFEAATLMGGEITVKPVGQYIETIGKKLAGVEEQVRKIDGVRDVGALYEFSIPGSFYIPGQNYLQLYLIEKPDEFLKKTYYEDKLGVDQPFRSLLQGMERDDVLVSKGFASSFAQMDHKPLGLGNGKSGEIAAHVRGAVYLLPGLSQIMMQGRESFSSASVEFINSIASSHPYVVGRLDSDNISRLDGYLASVVVHVSGRDLYRLDQTLVKLRQDGAIPPFTTINTEAAEKEKLSSDMFVYLALQNIKVFMIGGILVALAGLIAIGIVNFIEGKRIFALLRLRGASPRRLVQVILVDLLAPLLVGAGVGVPVGLITGYGLTNAIFALPRASSIMEVLPVHLTISWAVGAIVLGVLAFFILASAFLISWIFRKTAREALGGA